VPAEQVEAWRQKLPDAAKNAEAKSKGAEAKGAETKGTETKGTEGSETAPAPTVDVSRRELEEAATRTAWYAFFGAWVSMVAAAAGAYVGAGPRFRLVFLDEANRVVTSH
jgi:hypothetical protein